MPGELQDINDYIKESKRGRDEHNIQGVVPILDISAALDKERRPQLLKDLKRALFDIGFFYVKNPPSKKIPSIFHDLKEESWNFFNLPKEKKSEISMENSKHFLGYNDVGDELTAKHIDWREQVEFGTELPEPVINSDDELWKNIEGPNLWPDKQLVPNFRSTIEDYMSELETLSKILIDLIKESLNLPEAVFDKYFKEKQQCKMKIIRYPDLLKLKNDLEGIRSHLLQSLIDLKQGVGEHRDNDFLTIIYQATNHTSLQVQTFEGEWVNVPPIKDTFVVNVGQTLEYITNGVCVATVHRVLTPIPGEGDRLSIAFFQTVDVSSYKSKIEIPEEIQKEADIRDSRLTKEDISFQFPQANAKPLGYSIFLNRIKSHPKVGAKWYPDTLKYVQKQLEKA